MTVKRTSVRRTRSGNVAMTFEISPASWAALKAEAEAGGYFGRLDYLAAVLNMVLLECEPPHGGERDIDDARGGMRF